MKMRNPNARTTPTKRREIQRSGETDLALTARFKLNPKKVAQVRDRTTMANSRMGSKKPASTTLDLAQEVGCVVFRKRITHRPEFGPSIIPISLSAAPHQPDANGVEMAKVLADRRENSRDAGQEPARPQYVGLDPPTPPRAPIPPRSDAARPARRRHGKRHRRDVPCPMALDEEGQEVANGIALTGKPLDRRIANRRMLVEGIKRDAVEDGRVRRTGDDRRARPITRRKPELRGASRCGPRSRRSISNFLRPEITSDPSKCLAPGRKIQCKSQILNFRRRGAA